MTSSRDIIILGASTRAAAFSALRAGLRPWCADLFADRDLAARSPVVRVPASDYPHAFLEVASQRVHGPWIYTGALENRRKLVRQIARFRPLWGNDARALQLCRSPQFVASLLAKEDLPHARLQTGSADLPQDSRWLLKPIHGAGGTGIVFASPKQATNLRRKTYCQEYVEGESCSAVYLANGRTARLAGATRQLVGEAGLHAGPFQYCGSIGPLPLSDALRSALAKIGNVLTGGCRLRGLFGVDFILRGESPCPVELNPRYTASLEVLEYATGWKALMDHANIFGSSAAEPMPATFAHAVPFIGKAILFAREALAFPQDGPWNDTLRAAASVHDLPSFADIPHAGEAIE